MTRRRSYRGKGNKLRLVSIGKSLGLERNRKGAKTLVTIHATQIILDKNNPFGEQDSMYFAAHYSLEAGNEDLAEMYIGDLLRKNSNYDPGSRGFLPSKKPANGKSHLEMEKRSLREHHPDSLRRTHSLFEKIRNSLEWTTVT